MARTTMPQITATVPWGWDARQRMDALSFPVAEYEARLERTRREMEQAGLTHLIAYSNYADPGNVRWLTGFPTSYGDSMVVIDLRGEPMLVTNWVLHNEPMHSGIYTSWLHDTRVCARGGDDLVLEVADAVDPPAGSGARRIGRAGRRVIPARLELGLRAHLDTPDFLDGDAPLLAARRRKSPLEIERMRRAARITGAGLAAAMAACQPGVTEQAVGAAGHGTMFAAGAEFLGFDSAVASGPRRAGFKHCAPTWRVLQSGDMVFLDMGATLDGYYADVSRCVIVGDPPPEAVRLMTAAEDLFAEVAALARPGTPVAAWHEEALRSARQLPYGEHYRRDGFGHGLGCMLFERPNLRYGQTAEVLEQGMTFAFEPMFVVAGLGTGVVEETVLVTDDGLEPLSGLPTRTYSR
jgi:Xaa-Pro dipeptidase